VAESAPYLHDSRAATLEEAIRLHGGQGRDDARLRFAGLVIAFQAHGSGGAAVRRTLLNLPTA
jgi:CxxC motif-containing protein (DUF1111 family)